VKFEVHGTPKDLDGARALAAKDKLQSDGIDIVPQEARLERLAELVMQFTTPPEVRFKMATNAFNSVLVPRKAVEEGNGSTEGEDMPGVLATAFEASNPTLASRLLGTWFAQGQVYSTYFNNELLIIDRAASASDPLLGSDNFPGYASILRDGWGTPLERAAWLWNGDYPFDHRNPDQGGIVLYALGAPLSLEWSSFYSPMVDSGNMMSMALTTLTIREDSGIRTTNRSRILVSIHPGGCRPVMIVLSIFPIALRQTQRWWERTVSTGSGVSFT
jgi:hypothetical protein